MKPFPPLSKSLLIVVISFFGTFMPLLGFAEQPAATPQGSPMPNKMPMHKHADLNLSDSQREAMRNAMKQMGEAMRDGQDLYEQLGEIAEADKYDEKKAKALIRQQNEAREKNLLAANQAMHDFYQSLSPEQKEKFKQQQQERRARMQEQKDRMREHMKDRMNNKPAPALQPRQ